MTRRLLIALFSLWLPAMFVLFGNPSSFASTSTVFVDCDGDGFDDNAPDDDVDGIPDEFERHSFLVVAGIQLDMSQMFVNQTTTDAPVGAQGCGAGFGRRKFATRAVCENRFDFDAGFGSNLGLGSGLGGGGTCAGGVCF